MNPITRIKILHSAIWLFAFYLLWLSEILPSAFNNTTPSVLSEAGLFTNPVHVLDLAVLLPGIFITGILVLRKNKFALMLSPAVLMFFILMDLTICYLVMLMYERGLEDSQAVAFGMAFIGIFSIIVLNLFVRKYRSSPDNTLTSQHLNN